MPTLLQINVDANNGSNGGIARDIGKLVHENGWKSYIAYGRAKVPNNTSELIHIGNKLSCYLHGIESRLFDNHGLASRIATLRFLRQIDKIKPDVVQLHNIHGYYINYKYLFKYLEKHNIPTVWSFHDCWAMTGHCSHFIGVNCEKWKTECNGCPLKSWYPKSLIVDRSKQNYRIKKSVFASQSNLTIIPTSKWNESVVADSFLKNLPRHLIYNGVDLDLFKPTDSDLRSKLHLEGKFVMIGVATAWSKSKGLEDYYKLADRLPDDCQILLVGLNDELMQSIPSNIMGIKRTDSVQQLVQYYSMADLVLNLSYMETFGMTTVEGYACGTPCVSYNRTACPELIYPETGKVVEAGNIDMLVDAIKEIKYKGKQSYSSACRTRAVESFDKQKNFRQYLDIYNELLNNK